MKNELIFLLLAVGACSYGISETTLTSQNITGKSIQEGDAVRVGRGSYYSKQWLPIDSAKRYQISGEFKSLPGQSGETSIRFGVVPGDGSRRISPWCVNINPGSETELAAQCRAGDTVLKLKNAAKWRGNALTVVAFDVDRSGKCRDLPNFNFSQPGASGLKHENGVWLLTLNKPCTRDYPAGTPVREHLAGWTLIYAGTTKKVLTPDWQSVTAVIPAGEADGAPTNRWWKGTKQSQLAIDVIGGGALFRHVSLRELPPEALEPSRPEDFRGAPKVTAGTDGLVATGRGLLLSVKKLPVNTDRRWKLSGEFKAAAGTNPDNFIRFGMLPTDGSRQIQPVNINIAPGTETELAAPCNAGDRTLKLKDASKWKADAISCVAFDVDPGKELRDLPNFSTSGIGFAKLEKRDGEWLLTLKKPCGQSFPADTPVRQHRAGWSLIYAGSTKFVPTPEWKKLEVEIAPGVVTSADTRRWWTGTKAVHLVLDSVSDKVAFRNLKLEEITK